MWFVAVAGDNDVGDDLMIMTVTVILCSQLIDSCACRYEDAAVAAWEGMQLEPGNAALKKLFDEAIQKGRQEHQAKQAKP
jgi:hypothetical protein